jgi:hypothetical protein
MMTFEIAATYDEEADLRQAYQITSVETEDAGECNGCPKVVSRLNVLQHVNHRGYEYTMRFVGPSAIFYMHQDGTPQCGSHTKPPKSVCGKCSAIGTIEHVDTGYGDRSTCSACGDTSYFDRGD